MAFILQANPDRWDLRQFLIPDRVVRWYVRNYVSLMRPGEIVLFWLARGGKSPKVRGIYGWGLIDEPVYTDERGDLRLPVRYVERWVRQGEEGMEPDKQHAPIPCADVLSLPSWSENLISVNPQGSTFLVSEEQLRELTEQLIAKRIPRSQLMRATELYLRQRNLSGESFSYLTIPLEEGGHE